MLTLSEKPVVGPLHKSGGADSQKLSVATKFKVHGLNSSGPKGWQRNLGTMLFWISLL